MGKYGPDVRCPCPTCYACGGVGCDKCRDGVRCSKHGDPHWIPGLKVTAAGPRTVVCKLDMEEPMTKADVRKLIRALDEDPELRWELVEMIQRTAGPWRRTREFPEEWVRLDAFGARVAVVRGGVPWGTFNTNAYPFWFAWSAGDRSDTIGALHADEQFSDNPQHAMAMADAKLMERGWSLVGTVPTEEDTDGSRSEGHLREA